MMKKLFLLLFVFISFYGYALNEQKITNEAIVIVPVADCALYPLQLMNTSKSVFDIYNGLSCSPEEGAYACSRAHQLLFNEPVKVLQELGEEIECEVNNAFYQSENGQVWKFWTLKKNIKYLKDLQEKNTNALSFPSIYYNKESKTVNNKNILTLAFPWQDSSTKTIYSAGTRFVRANLNDDPNNFGVYIFDFQKNKEEIKLIPCELAFIFQDLTNAEKILNFVNLLKKWGTLEPLKLPFLWGGSSFTECVEELKYQLISEGNKKYWKRDKSDLPYSGFDAAEIVLRAAQICGIPYCLKTTFTTEQNLDALKKEDTLEVGDIIYVKGGQTVITDIKNNEIIISGGYKNWNGVIRTVKLSQLFENIQTFDDLLNVYFQNKSLRVLDCKGQYTREISEFKILKFKSIFNKF